MINTQKLTALGFAFYDGYRSTKRAKPRKSNENEEHSVLSEDQEKQKVTDVPTPIEYLSYIFYFHGVVVGPLCFFKDYRDFVEGSNLLVIPTSKITSKPSVQPHSDAIKQPSTFWPVTTKLAQVAIWGYFLIVHTPNYPIEYNLSQEMVNSPFFKRLGFLLFSTFCARVKYVQINLKTSKLFSVFLRYYFAFILSEAINNAAGLGYNGCDTHGLARWDLLTNMQPVRLERATSLKVILDVWNMRK